MLRLDDVRSGYGAAVVLQGLNLQIESGDRAVVLGRNGVGKTTLMQTVVGHLPVTSGSISFEEARIDRESASRRARRGIAYVPQGRQIFGSLSVLDNLRVAAFGVNAKSIRALLDEVLDELPALKPKLKDRGGSLSGGQQQILALGRALMTGPRLLLLDEPSEGIQPSIVDEIAEIVVRLNEQRGITILLVEQNLDFAAQIAQHAFIMDHGEVVRSLPVAEFVGDVELQHEYMGV